MTLHVGAAEELVARNPDRAREALASAGDVGRGALAEMDQLLGLLRSDDTALNPTLQPSLANLGALVNEFRDLGLAVRTRIDGDPVPLPTAVDQSAFRIIQEALTNTLKHAGPTEAEITLTYTGAGLSLEIRDHGRPSTPTDRALEGHTSQGIVGMRERTTLLKGELEVGRCGDDGFRVAARLPFAAGRRT
jgi:signal transduction histidine kinase